MKKGIYIYQDLVSNGVSDVFSAENDRLVKRDFGVAATRCSLELAYMYNDTIVYKIGVLDVDDETGQIVVEPIAPIMVCRGTDFEIGSARSVKDDEDRVQDDADLELPY